MMYPDKKKKLKCGNINVKIRHVKKKTTRNVKEKICIQNHRAKNSVIQRTLIIRAAFVPRDSVLKKNFKNPNMYQYDK